MKSLKKTYYLIGFIFVFFIILVFFVFILNNTQVQENSSQEPEEQRQPMSYVDAVMSEDVENCDLVLDSSLADTCRAKLSVCQPGDDECFYSKAFVEQDINLCYEISDVNMTTHCSFGVYRNTIFTKAVLEDDVTVCNLISEDETAFLRLMCYDNYYFVSRINKDDTSYCDYFLEIDEQRYQQCLEG